MLKLDKFTWSVVIVVMLVLVGAIITVNLTDGEGWGETRYRDENTPEAAVHNAFVAFMNQDYATARQYYTNAVLEDDRWSERFPGQRAGYYPDNTNRRLQIRSVDTVDEGEAVVTVVVDYYTAGGLFGGGDTWSSDNALVVIEEEGRWKIDTPWFFY